MTFKLKTPKLTKNKSILSNKSHNIPEYSVLSQNKDLNSKNLMKKIKKIKKTNLRKSKFNKVS